MAAGSPGKEEQLDPVYRVPAPAVEKFPETAEVALINF
jgi:hypothetical protein